MKRIAPPCLRPTNVTYAAIGYREAEVGVGNTQMIHIAGQVKDRSQDIVAVAAYSTLRKNELTVADLNTNAKYFVRTSATDSGSIFQAKAAGPTSKQINAQLGKHLLNFSLLKTQTSNIRVGSSSVNQAGPQNS